MADLIPQSGLNAVIDPQYARQYFENGALRWRLPHRAVTGLTGHDLDSMDMRGVFAAFHVGKNFPPEQDQDGNHIPADPEKVKTHMDLGLSAIQGAGLLPLDDRFVGGYTRIANFLAHIEQPREIETVEPHQ